MGFVCYEPYEWFCLSHDKVEASSRQVKFGDSIVFDHGGSRQNHWGLPIICY